MKVVGVDKKLCPIGKDCGDEGYVGMNCYAAKELNVSFPFNCDTVAVYSRLGSKERNLTIEHEKLEAKLMKKGMKYKEAHVKASERFP